ncbi:hypothetical protein PoB_003196600 [Plakobranchus ocellatus]|uniref:Uncharacterized protein n=1 Tax=Plakobranchus ocellatus TaxID=259542 RepID=A0AAV4AFQ1_9GAST|nr:hypothetical protein PoB_003196600 [Plakobranchus ocellatus]
MRHEKSIGGHNSNALCVSLFGIHNIPESDNIPIHETFNGEHVDRSNNITKKKRICKTVKTCTKVREHEKQRTRTNTSMIMAG